MGFRPISDVEIIDERPGPPLGGRGFRPLGEPSIPPGVNTPDVSRETSLIDSIRSFVSELPGSELGAIARRGRNQARFGVMADAATPEDLAAADTALAAAAKAPRRGPGAVVGPTSPTFEPAGSSSVVGQFLPSLGAEARLLAGGTNRAAADVLGELGVPGMEPFSERAAAGARRATQDIEAIGNRLPVPVPSVTPSRFSQAAAAVTDPRNVLAGVTQAAELAPAIGATVATRSPTPLLAAMRAITVPREYQRYKEEGLDTKLALVGSILQGETEAQPEKIFTSVILKRPIGQLLRGSPTQFAEAVRFVARATGAEATSEGISTTLNWVVDKALADPNATPERLVADLKQTAAQLAVQAPAMAGMARTARAVPELARRIEEEVAPGRAIGRAMEETIADAEAVPPTPLVSDLRRQVEQRRPPPAPPAAPLPQVPQRTSALGIEPAPIEQQHSAPTRPPGSRWEGDRGAMPGEPIAYLDAEEGGFDTAKAAITEREIPGRGILYDATDADGNALGTFQTIEEAARAAEKKFPSPVVQVPVGQVLPEDVEGEGGDSVRGNGTFTISKARYAKGQMIVRVKSLDGFKTRAGRIADAVSRGRYSNREHGYIMSPAAAKRFRQHFDSGGDAAIMSRDLLPPRTQEPAGQIAPDYYEPFKKATGQYPWEMPFEQFYKRTVSLLKKEAPGKPAQWYEGVIRSEYNKARTQEPVHGGPMPIVIEPSAAPLNAHEKEVERRANDYVQNHTEEAIERYRKIFGNEISPDNVRELFPDYSASNEARSTLAPAVHEASSALAKEIYRRLLAAPVTHGQHNIVLFTAGGSGAGKSGAIKSQETVNKLANLSNIIFDYNMANAKSAQSKIDQALAAGRSAVILYTYRDPIEAMVNGVLPRAMQHGRTVLASVHKTTHEGSPKALRQLRAHYKDNPNVEFMGIDNSNGRGKSEVVPIDELLSKNVAVDIKELRHAVQTALQEGRITETVARGVLGEPATPERPGAEGARAKSGEARIEQSQRGREAEFAFAGGGLEGLSDERSGDPAAKPGTPFIVYRVGMKPILDNRNAGNANAVADFLARSQDFESSISTKADRVHIFEVTVNEPFGRYEGLTGGEQAEHKTVGRNTVRGVSYSFPKGAKFTQRLIKTVTIEALHAELKKSYDAEDFDEAGTNIGAKVLRAAAERALNAGVSGATDTNMPPPQDSLVYGDAPTITRWRDGRGDWTKLGLAEDRGLYAIGLNQQTIDTFGIRTPDPIETQRIADAISDATNNGMPLVIPQSVKGWVVFSSSKFRYGGAYWQDLGVIGFSDDFLARSTDLINYRRALVNTMAHELTHHVDRLPGAGNYISQESRTKPALGAATRNQSYADDNEGGYVLVAVGPLSREFIDAYDNGPAELRAFFRYPLDLVTAGTLTMDRAYPEMVAQVGALYVQKPETVRKYLPEWFKVMEKTYGSKEGGKIPQPRSIDEAHQRLFRALQDAGSRQPGADGVTEDAGALGAGRAVGGGAIRGPPGGRVGDRARGSEEGAIQGSAVSGAERRAATITVDGKARSRLNSEGRPIAPSDEAIVNFWRWFGDSKVVDKRGRPIVVYHGTDAVFSNFQRAADTLEGANFFTDNEKVASMFAVGEGANVLPVYLRILNPKEVTVDDLYGTDDVDEHDTEIVGDLVADAKEKKHDGVIIIGIPEQGIKSTQFGVFKKTQIKSSIGNKGAFSQKPQSIVGAPAPNAYWDINEPGLIENLRREWQDNKIDLKKTQQAIRDFGGVLNERNDTYLAEQRYHGRVSALIQRFTRNVVEPLLAAIKDSGLTIEQVGNYLWARHAPERNAQMVKINPQGPANLSGLYDNPRAAAAAGAQGGANAADLLGGFSTTQRQALTGIARRIDDITKATRRLLVAEGLEDQSTIDAWERTYKHYVPLMRDIEEAGTGSGFQIKGPESKRAMGSQKEAVAIVAAVIAQHERAIVRAEKADVGRHLVKLAEDNPHPGFWKVDDPPMKRSINPTTGLVQVTVDPLYRNREDVYIVKSKDAATGKVVERVLSFNPQRERSMKLAVALKNLDVVQLSGITKVVGKVTRLMANLATSWNPVFWSTNVARDVQTAAVNLQSTPLNGHAPVIIANIPRALSGILSAEFRNGTGQWAALYRQFEEEGGKTGWMSLFDDLIDRQKQLVSEIKASQRGNLNPLKWGGLMIDTIDKTNSAIENATRLSIFAEGLRIGLSPRAAASLAKNTTVNFNRKGNRSSATNAWYMFFNASVQGSARLIQAVATSHKAQAMVGGMVAFAAAMEIINRMIGDRDRDEDGNNPYDLLDENVKQKNMIFMVPGSKGNYVTIPLPYGFNVFSNAGRLLTEAVLGASGSDLIGEKRKPIELAWNFAQSLIDSFLPFGHAASAGQLIAPSLLDPAVQYSENKTWFGGPLRPEPLPFGPATPNYKLFFRSTSDTAKDLSRWLSEATGGDEVRGGAIDVSPTTLTHIFGTVTGGSGRFVLGMFDFTNHAVGRIAGEREAEDMPYKAIPFIGKFYGEVDERDKAAKFYRLRNEALETMKQVKDYRKAGEHDKADALEEEKPALVAMAREIADRQFQKEMKGIRDEFKAVDQMPREERARVKRELQREEATIMSRALRAYNEEARP